jgi:hypothetical protein
VDDFAELVNAESSQIKAECKERKTAEKCHEKTECAFVDGNCVQKTFTKKNMIDSRGDQFFETTASQSGTDVFYANVNANPDLEYCDPGTWYGGPVSINGTVTNITADPVQGATVSVVGTPWSDVTAQDGTYAIEDVDAGTYDLAASAPNYATTYKYGFVADAPKNGVDFLLERPSTLCDDDCSYSYDSLCHAECDGFNKCAFYSETTKAACDGWPVGSRKAFDGQEVLCCKGAPYTPSERQKAEVKVNCPAGKTPVIVTSTKVVLYEGKLAKMKVLVFDCD